MMVLIVVTEVIVANVNHIVKKRNRIQTALGSYGLERENQKVSLHTTSPFGQFKHKFV